MSPTETCLVSHPLIDGGHRCVGMTVAPWSMADLPISQPLIGGPVSPRRDYAQNLQLKLQSVVGRGRRKADARHLFRRLNGQSAFTHQLWTQEGDRKDGRVKLRAPYLWVCLFMGTTQFWTETWTPRFCANPTHPHSSTVEIHIVQTTLLK